MDKKHTPEIQNTEKERSPREDTVSYKSIALDGPGLNAVVRLSDLKLLFVNRQFGHYLGYTNDDIAARDIYFTDILEQYQLHRFLYQVTNIKKNIDARSRYVIYRLKNKAGKITSYYLYLSPALNDEREIDPGQDWYYLTLHPDLSMWDMPYTSFITRELFLEHFNSEDFGTFEWIMDIDIVFWSVGLYRIYEVDDLNRQIDIKYEKSFIHPNDIAGLEEATQRSIDTGGDLNIDYRIITAKQNIKIIHCLARTIINEEGKAVKFAGSLRDVTNQRSAEDNLKIKVKELYHSNKELEEFAYVASHDMQEPLRKITTFSDRLSEKYKDVLTGDGAMYLARMIASAENMRSLINDLLEFSRISKTEQPFEPVSLNSILRQVRSDLELAIEDTGTIINSSPLPQVDAIGSQMKQLFTNIITNAIKFHKPDTVPLITIESTTISNLEKLKHELLPDTAYYKIQIADNGIGFEDEYASRIFQIFQRLHGKSEYPGSGIGLAICKKIVEYHHGIIYAENIAGTGARFVFIIPHNQQKTKQKQP